MNKLFIKLRQHKLDNAEELAVNVTHIAVLIPLKEPEYLIPGTKIVFTSGLSYEVKQTIEEILTLMEQTGIIIQ